MKKTRKLALMTLILGFILMISACTNNEPRASEATQSGDVEQTKSVYDNPQEDDKNLADPLLIPSESGDKKETTNEYGGKYKGMGNNIYSTIGSSGIHEGGVSSYFESVLKGEGITGVKVFAVDDSIVLARNKPETTSHEYDDVQRKVLSGTQGQTGKEEPQPQEQKMEHGNNDKLDNLNQAQEMMDDMFNGNVKILTVTDPKAIDLITNIKKSIESSDYQKASNEMVQLLNMAE